MSESAIVVVIWNSHPWPELEISEYFLVEDCGRKLYSNLEREYVLALSQSKVQPVRVLSWLCQRHSKSSSKKSWDKDRHITWTLIKVWTRQTHPWFSGVELYFKTQNLWLCICSTAARSSHYYFTFSICSLTLVFGSCCSSLVLQFPHAHTGLSIKSLSGITLVSRGWKGGSLMAFESCTICQESQARSNESVALDMLIRHNLWDAR